jgi:hypothetical protein
MQSDILNEQKKTKELINELPTTTTTTSTTVTDTTQISNEVTSQLQTFENILTKQQQQHEIKVTELQSIT